jgi:hypothetical protein
MAAIYFTVIMAFFALSVDSFALHLTPSKAISIPAVTSHVPCYSRAVRANLMTMRVAQTGQSTKIARSILVKAGVCIRSLILSIFLLFSGCDEPFSTSRMPIGAESHTFGVHRTAFINHAKRIDAGVQNSAPSIMLSMTTPESKKRLIAVVSGAYAIIWTFLFFTHDKGEKSE